MTPPSDASSSAPSSRPAFRGRTSGSSSAVHSEGEAKTLATLTLEAIAEAVVAEGVATPEEVDQTLAGLEAFVADPETLVAQPRIFQVWRRRA